jgi:hypothetical protein
MRRYAKGEFRDGESFALHFTKKCMAGRLLQ